MTRPRKGTARASSADGETLREFLKCEESLLYFVTTYGHVADRTDGEWLKFDLWPAQEDALRRMRANRLVVLLKARQLGITWLALHDALHTLLFKPNSVVLLFSLRDNEAVDLLARLKEVYKRLPRWCQCREVLKDDAHVWKLSNGSECRAFPTTAGDSYQASLVLIDEADLVPDLGDMLGRVKPTIDAGGRLVMVSRSNKKLPESAFKKTYRAAVRGEVPWHPIFLPWYARPDRTAEWYEEMKGEILRRTGAPDELHEHYPATEGEALAANSLDKRIPAAWLDACYREVPKQVVLPPGAPTIPGLVVYKPPEPGRRYAVGADPAEGNPTSDDSAAVVLDVVTGEEAASFAGKHEPSVLAFYLGKLGKWYNGAGVLVERNNHGHAVLLALNETPTVPVLMGFDEKEGWLSSAKGKALLFDCAADAFRDGQAVVHSLETYLQLCSIEGGTLRAPDGMHDDRAIAFALALRGCVAIRHDPFASATTGVDVPRTPAFHEMMQQKPGAGNGWGGGSFPRPGLFGIKG